VRLRDISVELAIGTPEWPGDTPYSCGWTASIADGSSVNLSSLTTSPHVGTHADAPVHVRDGWPGAHELPLDAFYGPAIVIDVTNVAGDLSYADIEPVIAPYRLERLLLKTGRSIATGTFPDEWPTLSESCAQQLVGMGIRLVGTALRRFEGEQVAAGSQDAVLGQCVHPREPGSPPHRRGAL
jgi:arylformamidase